MQIAQKALYLFEYLEFQSIQICQTRDNVNVNFLFCSLTLESMKNHVPKTLYSIARVFNIKTKVK